MKSKFHFIGNVGSQNFSISGNVYNNSKEQEKPLGGFVFDAVCAGCPYYIRSVSEEKSPNSKKGSQKPDSVARRNPQLLKKRIGQIAAALQGSEPF